MTTIADLPDVLPERTLTMDEAESVATACGASCVHRVTIEDPDRDVNPRVWMMPLLVGDRFILVSRGGGGPWEVSLLGEGLRDDDFLQVVEDVMGDLFDVDVERGATVWFDDDGEEIERIEGDGPA